MTCDTQPNAIKKMSSLLTRDFSSAVRSWRWAKASSPNFMVTLSSYLTLYAEEPSHSSYLTQYALRRRSDYKLTQRPRQKKVEGRVTSGRCEGFPRKMGHRYLFMIPVVSVFPHLSHESCSGGRLHNGGSPSYLSGKVLCRLFCLCGGEGMQLPARLSALELGERQA